MKFSRRIPDPSHEVSGQGVVTRDWLGSWMNLVGLMMDLLGKRFLPRRSLALFDFHTIRAVCEATISFRVGRWSWKSQRYANYPSHITVKKSFSTVNQGWVGG